MKRYIPKFAMLALKQSFILFYLDLKFIILI